MNLSDIWKNPSSNHVGNHNKRIHWKKATESKLNSPSSGVTVDQCYDIVAAMPNVESLYEYLLTLDKDYTNGVQGNFAHIVHLLHPMNYIKGCKSGLPLADIVTGCPRTECRAPLPLQTAYLMHIRNQTIYCPRCGGGILYETYMLAQFVLRYPWFKVDCTVRKEPVEFKIDVPAVPLCQTDELWIMMILLKVVIYPKFGEAYSSFPPSYEAWVKGKSDDPFTRMYCRKQWSKYGKVSSKDNRYYYMPYIYVGGLWADVV
ncbi:hypothetical protein THRCLA_04321 [Thraustotheca clavata]|uniref:CxC5 like cysteine cluster associated with KDZ domain-containing protein n=1 Tax=Thraustotheca clavata TaxID=74557 RepID=A0A1W0A031_9STRA|nr:hypothetical protein THRCLA_04321 [Thraustotheca clavata]